MAGLLGGAWLAAGVALVLPLLKERLSRQSARGEPTPSVLLTVGGVAVATAIAGVAPGLVPLVGISVGLVMWGRRKARAGRPQSATKVALVADLFVVGLSAGLTVRQCTRSVAGLVGGQVGESLGLAVAALDRGDSFVEAFFALSAQLDDSIAGFFGVLAVADRSGSGAAAVLSRFADHEREVERRRAQEALRTIPIRLLPPLIVCVLPAFCLTTVVPVIAAVLGSLELSLP